MYPGRYGASAGSYNVGYILTQFDVLSALSTQQMRSRNRQVDPAFATAVFIQYISGKLGKGKTKFETSLKLEDLERGLPQFVRSFHEARERTGLPPSRIFPALRRTQSSTPQAARLTRTSTSTGSTNIQGPNVAAIASRNQTVRTVRPTSGVGPTTGTTAPAPGAVGEGDELPPPPYSRMDPEPEMTAVLERQLSRAGGSTTTSAPVAAGGLGRPSVESTRSVLPTMSEDAPAGEMSDVERREMEQALAASREEQDVNMDSSSMPGGRSAGGGTTGQDDELERALAESRRQVEVDERRRRESMTFGDNSGGSGIPGGMSLGPTLPVRRDTDRLTTQMQGMDLMGGSNGESTQGSTQRPLEPIRTGISTNPFASNVNSVPASPINPNSTRISNNPFENPSYESNAPIIGSSHTSYAPPSGPPPGWQTPSQLPASANPFLQPQPRDVPPPVAPKPGRSNGSGITHGAGILAHQLGLTQSRQDDADGTSDLKRYDMVILVDDSGSMAGGRWRETRMALMEVAEQAAGFDSDGIDVHFINDSAVGEGLRSGREVDALFARVKPGAQTPTGRALDRILTPYMNTLEACTDLERRGELPPGEGVKPMNLIVITDGAPTDDPASLLVQIARRLDQGDYPLSQVRVKLLQIGNEDGAREALQHLDEAISSNHGVRDMVDMLQGSLTG